MNVSEIEEWLLQVCFGGVTAMLQLRFRDVRQNPAGIQIVCLVWHGQPPEAVNLRSDVVRP